MNIIFLMDPLFGINYKKDTSFKLMQGAQKRGHSVFFMAQGGLSLTPDGARFDVVAVDASSEPIQENEAITLTEADVDAVFIRTDPPFDSQYLMDMWLLEQLDKRIKVVNAPRGIRTVNEKVWATQFKPFIPPTLVTSDKKRLLAFLSEHKKIILKPTDGFGGSSIFSVTEGDTNCNVIIETMTLNGKVAIIAQPFIPEAAKGDKRILLLNGDPLGAVMRVHASGDHRNNFFAGGKDEATDITPRDYEIIAALKPHLLDLGLFFVGIDIIGDYLIEVNVTSPTCLQEMNRLYDVQLEDAIIASLETLKG